jgi:peptide deformylase
MQTSNFNLKKDPDPILYQKLEDYDFACGMDAHEIERVMIAIMEDEYGIGISANQVGFDRRVVVIQPKGQAAFALFNPVIIDRQGECPDEEGCLSFPGLFMQIKRSQTITATYLDKDAKECTITLSGMDAKCLQHEIDHLDGICFTSHVSKMKLDLARKRQRKLLNGRTK